MRRSPNTAGQPPPRRLLAGRLGKINNWGNTELGLALGLAGHAAAAVAGRHPRIGIGDNAIEFMNNPMGGHSAMTIGNVTFYHDDPYAAGNKETARYVARDGYPPWKHEDQHTYQGEQLGPAYLPSNPVGGLYGLMRDGDWHGGHNWNERGPLTQITPQPWAPAKRP